MVFGYRYGRSLKHTVVLSRSGRPGNGETISLSLDLETKERNFINSVYTNAR